MSHRAERTLAVAGALALLALAGCPEPQPPIPPDLDTDGDCIPDIVEGRTPTRFVDTDGDGRPDHADPDSDGDGLDDRFESLNPDCRLDRAPADSDGDGVPNHLDLDSDDNGIPDSAEGEGDQDGDGLPDFADPDDDGDGIPDVVEIGPEPAAPLDTDLDGTPDFRDVDSDGDTILDREEGTEDSDGDGVPDRLDLDSDDDGIADSEEAGDSDPATPAVDTDLDGTPDYLDLDSDDDWLSDEWESSSGAGTDPRDPDTDGDGALDWLEVRLGTDPLEPEDNPESRGIVVVPWPYGRPAPEPTRLAAATVFEAVDVLLLVDLTESMQVELGTVRSRLLEIVNGLACGPREEPAVTGCVPDLWLGFAWFTEADDEPDLDGFSSYTGVSNLTGDHAAVQAAMPLSVLRGANEAQHKAVYCAAHGPGGSCPPDAQNLDEFPCPPGRVGFPCFRADAHRMLVLVTDEETDQDPEPGALAAAEALLAAQVTFLGINAEAGHAPAVTEDLEELALLSGSVDESGLPLVFHGADSEVAGAVSEALGAASRPPRDVTLSVEDDRSDAEDVTAFVEFVRTAAEPSGSCTDWPETADRDGDGRADTYLAVPPGRGLCWELQLVANEAVRAVGEPLLLGATLRVLVPPAGPVLRAWPLYLFVTPR